MLNASMHRELVTRKRVSIGSGKHMLLISTSSNQDSGFRGIGKNERSRGNARRSGIRQSENNRDLYDQRIFNISLREGTATACARKHDLFRALYIITHEAISKGDTHAHEW